MQTNLNSTVASGFLPSIERYKRNNTKVNDGKGHVKFSPNETTVELTSPNGKEVFRVKNPKVKIASDPLRFAELKHIEQ